jgi:hypothetical protein
MTQGASRGGIGPGDTRTQGTQSTHRAQEESEGREQSGLLVYP